MRRRMADAWWDALGRAGLSQARWRTWPAATRRGVKASVALAIGLVLVALFGVWNSSALAIAAAVLVLVVPSWDRLRVRGLAVGQGFICQR